MSEKSVLFLHRYGPQMASYRYRAQIPSEEVSKINGFRCGLNAPGDYDILVVSKPNEQDLPVIEHMKSAGGKIVVDFCDDHFNDAQAPLYGQILAIADSIVTGTDVMRNRIMAYTNKEIAVIGDPYEQPECAPHADGDRFLWFGHTRNLGELTGIAKLLNGRQVMIATGPKAPPAYPTIWGPEALSQALAASNIVLLPTQPGAEYKTPNRLLNAIRAGCFPVCMGHPSYAEFKRFVWVGHFPTGLTWVDAFKSDLNDCVKAAQDYIRDRYSSAAIGAAWADYLESV